MAIQYNEKKRIFSLHTAHTTYQMMADSHDYLLHLYYGKHAVGEMDYLLHSQIGHNFYVFPRLQGNYMLRLFP